MSTLRNPSRSPLEDEELSPNNIAMDASFPSDGRERGKWREAGNGMEQIGGTATTAREEDMVTSSDADRTSYKAYARSSSKMSEVFLGQSYAEIVKGRNTGTAQDLLFNGIGESSCNQLEEPMLDLDDLYNDKKRKGMSDEKVEMRSNKRTEMLQEVPIYINKMIVAADALKPVRISHDSFPLKDKASYLD